MGSKAFTDFTYSNGVIIIESGKITGDLVITAEGTIKQYTVTFDSNGGSAVDVQKVEHGDKATLPTPPTKTGYTFVGWYSGETRYDFGAAVTADITLTARWEINTYTVTFDSGVAAQKVEHGKTAVMPDPAPAKDGYTFVGWYLGETAYDFSAAVTADVTLTAKWQVVEYRITYVLNGGANAEGAATSYTLESKDITLLAPARAGYTFAGWYTSEVGGDKLESILSGSTGDITLYARWTVVSYTVTLEPNGGSVSDGAGTQIVAVGGKVAYVEPVRDGYLFVGWYGDRALTARYDFNSDVTQSFTLYAKWRLQTVAGEAPDGTTITVSSESGFDDGTTLRFTEVTEGDIFSRANEKLAENISLKKMYDIQLVAADGTIVPIENMLSVGISVSDLGTAVGRFAVVYVSDDGTSEELATHIGADGNLYFFVEHFSHYAIVDITEVIPAAGFAWWWILVAVGACAIVAVVAIIIARSNRRYELNYVNGGVPPVKLKESMLVELPIPERETEVFEGWYYDEDFRDRALLTSMPKQNLILFAKWRTMTQEERIARDRAHAEAASAKDDGEI